MREEVEEVTNTNSNIDLHHSAETVAPVWWETAIPDAHYAFVLEAKQALMEGRWTWFNADRVERLLDDIDRLQKMVGYLNGECGR